MPPSTECVLLEHLHHDPRVAAVGDQRLARVVEVGVRVVARLHLLDRQVEDLAAVGGRYARGGGGTLALQARVERGLRDLDLLRRGLGRRDPALQLRPGPGEQPSRPGAPGGAPSSRRSPSTRRRHRARRRARQACAAARERGRRARRRPRRRGSAGRRGASRSARAPSRAPGAVLVGADRDVLGAVVGGQLAAAERDQRRGERDHAADELLRHRREARGLAGSPAPRRRRRPSPRARYAARTRTAPRAARAGRAAARASPRAAAPARAAAAGPTTPRSAASRRTRPSASRLASVTAHAHEVGPWTSTPFASAMPPRRSFFSSIRLSLARSPPSAEARI